MSEVVTLGECLASFVALERVPFTDTSTFLRSVAGAEANVAVGLARLGRSVAFIGRVGDDGFGTHIRRVLRGEGVDISRLEVDERAPTGVMIRERRAVGPSEVVYWRRGSAGSRLSAHDVRAADGIFEGIRWLHITGITPALSPTAAAAVDAAVERARLARATVSLDLDVRRRLWPEREAVPVLAGLAARSDVVYGGHDEVALVAGLARTLEAAASVDTVTAADALLAFGPRSVVVKSDHEPILERLRRGGATSSLTQPLHGPIQSLDPVGAGDAFAAGYIAASLEGAPPDVVLRAAAICGAAAAAGVGDMAGLMTRRELDQILAPGAREAIR